MNIVRHLVCLALLGWAVPSQAGLIVVDTVDDENNSDGDCSLREAIIASNTNAARDGCPAGNSSSTDQILILIAGTIQTPTLVGLPTVTERVTITGNAELVIDGRGIAPIFTVDMANAAHDFALSGNGMRLRRGRALSHGGGALYVVNADQVTVTGVTFEDNRACDLLLSGNCSPSPDVTGQGGAIGFGSGDGDLVNGLTLTDCRFLRNEATGHGGAIASAGVGTGLTMTRTTLIGNLSHGHAGGLRWVSTKDAALERVIFMGNQALKAYGGATFFYPYAAGPYPRLLITNALIADNVAGAGPDDGIFPSGLDVWGFDPVIAFSSIVRNVALNPTGGSGLKTTRSATFLHSVVADNHPRDYGGVVTGTAISSYTSDGSASFMDLPPASAALSGWGAFLGADPIALPSVHSPSIDGGAASCLGVGGTVVAVDLLGNPRPADGDESGGAACDIGAIEVQPPYDLLFGDGFESGFTTAWN